MSSSLLHVQVYPDLIKDVRIRVIELMDHVLSTYDRAISEYTAREFSRYAFYSALQSGQILGTTHALYSVQEEWTMVNHGLQLTVFV